MPNRMQSQAYKIIRIAAAIFGLGALLASLNAQAVPSFANQTGQSCVACHAGGQYPELTPYGRTFKLTGYNFGERTMPLSGMAVATYTRTKNKDTSLQGGDPRADFPKDGNPILNTGSLFLAGKVTDHIGGFAQITYNNYDSQSLSDSHWKGATGSDNMDIRYTDRFIDAHSDLIVGLTMNNNPNVQDVWNSAPAWGFNTVPGSSGPTATPLLAGGLAQSVTGVGAYAYWNKTVYAELSFYRNATGAFSFMSQGKDPARGNQVMLNGYNPYWRLALTHEWGAHNVMVGTSGMIADQYPTATDPSGPTDRYRDIGLDAQYQYLLAPHTVTAQVSYIKEKHSYATPAANPGFFDMTGTVPVADPNSSDTLNMLRAKMSYVYQAKYGGSLSYFNVTGSTNSALQTAGFDDTGAITNVGGLAGNGYNASGDPSNNGWTVEVFWMPVQFARIGLQYTNFNKYNGASSNYDGYGRNAKDNNTTFLYVWGAY